MFATVVTRAGKDSLMKRIIPYLIAVVSTLSLFFSIPHASLAQQPAGRVEVGIAPTFVFPASGQTLPYTGNYLFQVDPVAGATEYLWSFVQSGAIVWQNLAFEGQFSSNSYIVKKGSLAHSHFKPGDLQVWVRTVMATGKVSASSTVAVRLQGVTSIPAKPQPATSQPKPKSGPPAPGTILYQADTSGGLDKWTGTTDWKHLNGMLINDGSVTQASWAPIPYQVQGTNDYAVEAEIQVVKVDSGNLFGISLRHTDAGDYNGHVLFHCCGEKPTAGLDYVNYKNGANTLGQQAYDPGTDWHTYRLEAKGNQLRFLIDGSPIISTTDNRFLTGQIAGLWGDSSQFNVRRVAIIAL